MPSQGTTLKANLTGPAATVADLTVAGAKDRLPIELAIAVLLLLILAIIYRNPTTMMLPLITIGASLLTAQGVVAAISLFTGMAISNQTIVFLSAMIAGAGTDYAVFLISRYHDYVRLGDDSDLAVRRGLVSIGRVILASAATVGVTFLGMGFAKLGVFSTVGVALAVGIGVAFLAAVTLLPAVLVLAGRRGWVVPRSERTAGLWRRSGVRIVRRPAAYLAASLVILIALASCYEPGPVQLRRSQAAARICRELRRLCRAGTPLPGESDHSRIPVHQVAARPAHAACPCRSGTDGAAGQPASWHRDGPRRHPADG